jgi:hypothetical protein
MKQEGVIVAGRREALMEIPGLDPSAVRAAIKTKRGAAAREAVLG